MTVGIDTLSTDREMVFPFSIPLENVPIALRDRKELGRASPKKWFELFHPLGDQVLMNPCRTNSVVATASDDQKELSSSFHFF